MSQLLDEGLVEYYDEDAGFYQITYRSRAYLDGELDADDLERNE